MTISDAMFNGCGENLQDMMELFGKQIKRFFQRNAAYVSFSIYKDNQLLDLGEADPRETFRPENDWCGADLSPGKKTLIIGCGEGLQMAIKAFGQRMKRRLKFPHKVQVTFSP